MKYILLDFDGVLTSESWTRQCIFERRPENLFGLDWFDPKCLQALKTVVDATDAGIVVSSSWRELGKDNLALVWEEENLPGRLMGTTPEWVLMKRDAILEWISHHTKDKYVIIDDQNLHLSCQIQTNPEVGLTSEDALKAISILSE